MSLISILQGDPPKKGDNVDMSKYRPFPQSPALYYPDGETTEALTYAKVRGLIDVQHKIDSAKLFRFLVTAKTGITTPLSSELEAVVPVPIHDVVAFFVESTGDQTARSSAPAPGNTAWIHTGALPGGGISIGGSVSHVVFNFGSQTGVEMRDNSGDKTHTKTTTNSSSSTRSAVLKKPLHRAPIKRGVEQEASTLNKEVPKGKQALLSGSWVRTQHRPTHNAELKGINLTNIALIPVEDTVPHNRFMHHCCLVTLERMRNRGEPVSGVAVKERAERCWVHFCESLNEKSNASSVTEGKRVEREKRFMVEWKATSESSLDNNCRRSCLEAFEALYGDGNTDDVEERPAKRAKVVTPLDDNLRAAREAQAAALETGQAIVAHKAHEDQNCLELVDGDDDVSIVKSCPAAVAVKEVAETAGLAGEGDDDGALEVATDGEEGGMQAQDVAADVEIVPEESLPEVVMPPWMKVGVHVFVPIRDDETHESVPDDVVQDVEAVAWKAEVSAIDTRTGAIQLHDLTQANKSTYVRHLDELVPVKVRLTQRGEVVREVGCSIDTELWCCVPLGSGTSTTTLYRAKAIKAVPKGDRSKKVAVKFYDGENLEDKVYRVSIEDTLFPSGFSVGIC